MTTTDRPTQQSTAAQRTVLALTWLYCLSWALDFRGTEQGGSAFQMLSFAVTAGTGLLLGVVGWSVLFRRPLGWLILLWAGFLVSTMVVAQVQHVPMGQYVRTILPWFLVLTSMTVCQVAAGFGLSMKKLLVPVLASCAVNVVWRAFYALVISGRDIELVRVEMLSQCLPLLMAYLMCGLFLQRSWPVWPVLLGGLGLASYVMSVTRSAAIIIAAAGAAALLALWYSSRRKALGAGFGRRKLIHSLAGAGTLAAVLAVLGVFAPFVFQRWTERLFHSVGSEYTSMDPSTLTRLAETESFLKILDGDPLNYTFGMGIGHSYYWDESYAVELAYTYGNVDLFRAEFRDIWFPGHAIWTYAVFSGGFISLVCHVLLFALSTGIAWRAGRDAVRRGGVPLHLAWLPFVSIVAFTSASLTFNPFIERSAGLIMGIVMGLPQFVLRDTVRQAAAAYRARLLLAAGLLPEKGAPA